VLFEVRAGLVLVPLEVAEANRGHFDSLGDLGLVDERAAGADGVSKFVCLGAQKLSEKPTEVGLLLLWVESEAHASE
jgi:hypothetical protein